eukprot:TRINITY_DN813_c0_g1_i1.p1 TRINITY_DN813_c0_g1~~TRINITY_DN813_c0_g1_i1.p1  ORF type:complete len:477 (+),score=127.91 TRINITY_DN813_c0_g1_i1:121-1551(+)
MESATTPFDFTYCPSRHGTGSFKWGSWDHRFTNPGSDEPNCNNSNNNNNNNKDAGIEAEKVIPMWVADMDVCSPACVADALAQRAAHPVYGYTAPSQAMRKNLISWLNRKHHWQDGATSHPVQNDWLMFFPGVVAGVNIVLRALSMQAQKEREKAAEPCIDKLLGDVVVSVPAYPPFLFSPELHNQQLLAVPLARDGKTGEFSTDWKLVDAALAKLPPASAQRPRTFILCNPHNPSGRVFTRDELREVADYCERNNFYVISDEIWADLVMPPAAGRQAPQHIPFACVCSPALLQRTVTLMAPSKTFNVPGLGCSIAIVPDPQLRQLLMQGEKGIVPHPNLMGYVAAETAWGNPQSEQWLDGLLQLLADNRTLLRDTIHRWERVAGLSDGEPVFCEPEATYLAWFNAAVLLRRLGRDDLVDSKKGLAEELADRVGVGLSDGAEFADAGWLRINFGCPSATLAEALKRLDKVFGSRAK